MTNAELLILSLLDERPRTCHEIGHLIEERRVREWAEIGSSSIYYLLSKLERDGLVGGRVAEVQRRPRKVYHLTATGERRLRAAVLDALSVARRHHSALEFGLANLPSVEPTEALALLDRYNADLTARLEHLRRRWRTLRPLPYFVEAMFGHAAAMIEAELRWGRLFLSELQAGRDAIPRLPRLRYLPETTVAVAEGTEVSTADIVRCGAALRESVSLSKPLYGEWFGPKGRLRCRYLLDGPTIPGVPRPFKLGLAIPDGTWQLAQARPDVPITIDVWQEELVAEVHHAGGPAEEAETLRQVSAYLESQGYERTGQYEYEKEFLTDLEQPEERQRVILRCPVSRIEVW